MMSEADFDALTLKKSMDGIGTKEKLMIFVIAPQNNARVLAARARYDEKVVLTCLQLLYREVGAVLPKLADGRFLALLHKAFLPRTRREIHNPPGLFQKLATSRGQGRSNSTITDFPYFCI